MEKKAIKKAVKMLAVVLLCRVALATVEGVRLIGSTNPGKYPLINLGGMQMADTIALYESIGFSQAYHLTTEDAFVYGEFKVLGIRFARWEA